MNNKLENSFIFSAKSNPFLPDVQSREQRKVTTKKPNDPIDINEVARIMKISVTSADGLARKCKLPAYCVMCARTIHANSSSKQEKRFWERSEIEELAKLRGRQL